MSEIQQEKKLAQNEALFRDVNENIEKAAVENRYQGGDLPEFVCECSDPGCGALIQLSLTQYEDVRRYPQRFLVRPGHAVEEIENIIERYDSFVVVEKVGVGRETAIERDPRIGGDPGLPPP